MRREPNIKLLITSVGSGVGSNLLDSLEFEAARRRAVSVIGLNSVADAPNNFRCDRCYFVENTASPKFADQVQDIIRKEKPDLIFCGRDEDTVVIATLAESDRELARRSTCGNVSGVRCALNKWETAKFASRHRLPYAESFVLGSSGDQAALEVFARRTGFPIIGKPIEGFASKGVFFLRTLEEAKSFANPGVILQEYLGEEGELTDYLHSSAIGVPLFAHAPNVHHYSCHVVILPDGDLSEVVVSKNEHQSGATVRFRRVANLELSELALAYARAMHSEGGYGPFTIQFRQNRYGRWKAFEMNLRANGNTFPRFLIGQDDIELMVNKILGPGVLPPSGKGSADSNTLFCKSLISQPVHLSDVERLAAQGVWDRSVRP